MMAILSPGVRSFAGMRKTFMPAAAAFALLAGASAAQAQFFDRSPAPRDQSAESAPSGDAAATVRIDRLENQVRNLNGQVEQLQFQVKRLEDQLRKFQLDVDSRFQDSAGKPGPTPATRPAATTTPQRRSDLRDDGIGGPLGGPAGEAPGVAANVPPPAETDEAAPIVSAEAASAVAAAPVALGPDGRRHDAFDPAAQPNAPGAPLALGSADSASKPLPQGSSRPADARAAVAEPLDLTPPALRGANAAPAAAVSTAPGAAPSSVATLAPNAAGAAALAPGAPVDPIKAEYDVAADQLRAQRYAAAQQAFAAFVQRNPHSRLIAPAIYHLGESYYYQQRHREAAEQFLKIATDYAKSPVAPDAMVKLGVSLNALGAKEQACAFFSELPRKYPNAPSWQKLAAEREAKKASC
ncbi:tol-pal system protein YbgF [Rhodoblastus sp.]|uniref:tol-pal system protein YbgF n=1 Tax=Rhodoblastus sp. TaxID=1962975 RepID=UPI0035B0A81E